MGEIDVWLFLYAFQDVYKKKTHIQSVYNVTGRKLSHG